MYTLIIIIISMFTGFFFTKYWLEQLSNFLSEWRYQEIKLFNNSLVVHGSTHRDLMRISERLKNIENKLEGKHD